jgi:putative membrane protein
MSVFKGMAAGALGGLMGAWMMNRFQEAAHQNGDGREVHDAAPGAPRSGRGPQPVQSNADATQDATAQIAEAITEPVLNRPLSPDERVRGGSAVHFAFGAATGALYGAAAETWRGTATGAGIPFGLTVWAVADEGIVPALGLSRGPRTMSREALAYGLLSHVVFGLTTDAVRRVVRRTWR